MKERTGCEKKIVGLIKNIYKINFSQDLINRALRPGNATEDKERSLLIALKEETNKHEIFQNLNKIRDAGSPFNKVIITHDLTKKQKEKPKDLMEDAQGKQQRDE